MDSYDASKVTGNHFDQEFQQGLHCYILYLILNFYCNLSNWILLSLLRTFLRLLIQTILQANVPY